METIENHLNELRSFYYVAKNSSFTGAANDLPISKAQVSKDVLRLETVLGIQLFNRTTRRVVLTEEGQGLYQKAQQILTIASDAEEAMNELKGRDLGSIKITAPGSLGHWFIPDIVASTQENYPDVKLTFDLNNVERDLIGEKFDFALRAMNVTDLNLVARYLGQIKDSIVVSKAFYKKHKKLIESEGIKSLDKLECLLNAHQDNWNTWHFQKGNKDIEVKVTGRYSVSSYITSRKLCFNSVGVAKLPYLDVYESIQKGELVELFKEYKISTHPLYLVYPSSQYRTSLKNKYKEFLIKWFKGQKEFLV